MKKIILFTIILIFIPFFIVNILGINEIEEIELKYINNINIRVKRLATNEIQIVPLEEYIVGVLAGEMPVYFELEALKAQAVASRSYVLKRLEYNKDSEYDVVDSVLNQVYLDDNYLKEAWGKDYVVNINKLRTAVNETIDEYLEYDGEIIDALFFSTSNGYTEDASIVFNLELPYLKSVESKWDAQTSSVFNSQKTMSLQEFYEKLGLEYKKQLSFNVLERSDTNRIIKLEINGNMLNATDVYNKLGLRSTDFNLTQVGTNVVIDTKGYGHGVGMSQYGALGMAKEGYNYMQILEYYYTDAEIKKIQN